MGRKCGKTKCDSEKKGETKMKRDNNNSNNYTTTKNRLYNMSYSME